MRICIFARFPLHALLCVCVRVAERRCDGLAVFVKEENKRLGGPFEVDIFNNMTLEECQTMCVRAEKYVWSHDDWFYILTITFRQWKVLTEHVRMFSRYFCRSVEFDDQTKQCILSEEDSISQKDDISVSSSPTHHFYDLVCLDNRKYLPASQCYSYSAYIIQKYWSTILSIIQNVVKNIQTIRERRTYFRVADGRTPLFSATVIHGLAVNSIRRLRAVR